MVKIQTRMRRLKDLFNIRFGPGAAVLPRDVKRIHLDFAIKHNHGHYGARKFWHNCLPRLKYHNPAVSMTVNRTNDNKGPATLTVFFAPPPHTTTATSPAAPSSTSTTGVASSAHASFDRTESIDMKRIEESDIVARLMALTKATQIFETSDERAEMQALKESIERGRQFGLAASKVGEKKKMEEALLERARLAILEAE